MRAHATAIRRSPRLHLFFDNHDKKGRPQPRILAPKVTCTVELCGSNGFALCTSVSSVVLVFQTRNSRHRGKNHARTESRAFPIPFPLCLRASVVSQTQNRNARIVPVRHRSHATYSRQPRQVRKEATVTGSCVCSEVPVPDFFHSRPQKTLIKFNYVIPAEAESPVFRAIPRSRGTCFCFSWT